jgi:hypothetical protein
MDYTKTFKELKSIFTSDESEIVIPGSKVKIHNVNFEADVSINSFSNRSDVLFPENISFSYPVFTPIRTESNKVILLLHGLNERSWIKYLTWAYYLALNTDSYVILFPISFHINRSPQSWKDPRAMIPFMKNRNVVTTDLKMSSFANVALSKRLTEDPLRFLTSGYQTVADLTKLLGSIRRGEHPVIPQSDKINVFAYSIGAFLAEILIMGNPEKLFDKSKLFIFCGGSVFSNMRGSSKLIMDSLAFERLYNYYLNDFEKSITGKSPLVEFLRSSQIGMAFRSMIDLGRLKTFREPILKKLSSQIRTITLLKDTVIPSEGVLATLGNKGKKRNVDVWDFPYVYSHENPFPILDLPLSKKVDYCFDSVFSEARAFLS